MIDVGHKPAHLIVGNVAVIRKKKDFVDTGWKDDDILFHAVREVFQYSGIKDTGSPVDTGCIAQKGADASGSGSP